MPAKDIWMNTEKTVSRFQFIAQSVDDIVGAAICRPAHRTRKFVLDSGEFESVLDHTVGTNCVRPTE